MKTILIAMLLVLATTTTSFAQTANVASGGDASGTSWSVGQVLYKNFDGTSHGVQQAHVTITSIAEVYGITCEVYPNPTTSSVAVDCEGHHLVKVFDSNGKLIEEHVFFGKNIIDFSSRPAAHYVLNVYREKDVATFKVIKL